MLGSLLIVAGAQALPGNPDASLPPVTSGEIVVVGERPRASIPGAIAAEATLDAAAVAALGASNVTDILAQITGLTSGSQSRAGDGPVLLVNGRRIGAFSEVANLPPEAIARIDVLPEEAALRMGFPAGIKPVNIVLKARYAATTGEAEDRFTTRGLRNDFNAEMNAVKIDGDSRMTFDLQYQQGDAITEAKRGIVRPLDPLAASMAGIVTNAGGGALAPTGADYLAVPATGRTLGDFIATSPADGTGAWHTLTPASQEFTANAAFARALGGGLTFSANGRVDRLTTDDLLGPAIATVTIPAGEARPFTVPIDLSRIIHGFAPQTRHTRADTLHLGAQVAGNGAWQWTLSANYDRIAIDKRNVGGVDASLWQNAIDLGGVVDPFVAPSPAELSGQPSSASNSRDNAVSAEAFLSGPLLRLPAGLSHLSLRATVGRETLAAHSASGTLNLLRDHLGAQASLDLPVTGRHSAIGALDAGINAGGDRWSDAGSTQTYGANLTWKPAKSLSLLLAGSHDAVVPTMQQLGAPLDVTPAATLYDFATGLSTTIASTSGGSSALVPDSRSLAKAELEVKAARGLTLTTTLTDITDRNELFAFAGLAPAFVTAFPARFQTDAAGALVAIDARPFIAAREHRDELRLAAVFMRTFNASVGPSLPGGRTFGGGHAFAANGSMVQFSLTDTIRLADKLTLVAGGPALDLVGADPLGDGLRVPRHRIEAQLSATHSGMGLRANAVWTSGGEAGAGTPGALRFSDRLALNVRLFWFPAGQSVIARAAPWTKGLRFLLAVDNVFDSYLHVTDRLGQTPLAYQRGLLDPIGRTLRFSIRKTLP